MRKNFHVIITKHLLIEKCVCDKEGNPVDRDTLIDECLFSGDIINVEIEEAG